MTRKDAQMSLHNHTNDFASSRLNGYEGGPSANSEDEKRDRERLRAEYVARETGISHDQALALIELIGMDLPALLRQGRLLARRN